MKRALAVALATVCGFILVACASGGDGGGTGSCGNGVKDGVDQCDGTDLGGVTCQVLGFKGGTPLCNPTTCQLDLATCCQDTCANVGDTQCAGTALQSCTQQASGCRGWTLTADCAQSGGGVCDSSGGKPACSTTCTSSCPTVGASQCNAGSIEHCTTSPSTGCNEWVEFDNCTAKGQSCDATSGTAVCGGSCNNQCAKAGDTQCSGNVLRTCQAGTDGCLALVTTSDCAATGQTCTTASGKAQCTTSCSNKCSSVGSQNCIGNVLSTCASDATGCLEWQSTEDCSAKSMYCKLAGAGKAKCEGICTDPCPTLNAKKCNANLVQECKVGVNGCQDWQVTTTCALGQKCEQSGTNYSCVAGNATGEDCGGVVPIKAGKNTINWTATKNDYLTPIPTACSTSSYSLLGPDLVLVYTAGFTGSLEFSVDKPVSSYVVVAVATGTCGTIGTPSLCSGLKDYSYTTLSGSLSVTKGTTYFFYVGKLNYSTATPLQNPLVITLAEVDCTTFAASAVSMTPANAGTSSTLAPKLSVDFDVPLVTTGWTVKLTGNKGTNITYTYPNAAVTWTNNNKTMLIKPGVAMPAGELVTVDLTGLTDTKCSKAIQKPTWKFTVITPPCLPGSGGMVGTTKTNLGATGASMYYMDVDQAANGYVYFGSTSGLWRIGKTNTTKFQLTNDTGVLGYGMLMNGADPFTIKYKAMAASSSGYLYKLVPPTGGGNWGSQDFMALPASPTPASAYPRSGASYKGKIYLLNGATSTTTATEIWSVSATGTAPVTATLEASITGESYCNGLAVDDKYFYAACGTLERLVRIDRTTKAVTLITDGFDLYASTYANGVAAHDTNNDGTADFLYFRGALSDIYYVCNPAGAQPYADTLVSFGTSTSSYTGLGFDAANKKLYAIDNSTQQIWAVQ